jgi:acetyl-CoA acetyltransferase
LESVATPEGGSAIVTDALARLGRLNVAKEIETPFVRTDVSPGAIAHGHPFGATGAPLLTSLVFGLRRHGLRYGLQPMCEAGGMANTTIDEAL